MVPLWKERSGLKVRNNNARSQKIRRSGFHFLGFPPRRFNRNFGLVAAARIYEMASGCLKAFGNGMKATLTIFGL